MSRLPGVQNNKKVEQLSLPCTLRLCSGSYGVRSPSQQLSPEGEETRRHPLIPCHLPQDLKLFPSSSKTTADVVILNLPILAFVKKTCFASYLV